jgi:CheY-like chemotaxis protein
MTRQTILLVDDDMLFRNFVWRLLAPDYDVLTANDGEYALQILEKNTPALVLTDIIMPRKNGIELLTEMRRRETMRRIPVIVLFATGSPDDVRAVHALSGTNIIAKEDVTKNTLLALITKVLEESRTRPPAGQRS